MPRGPDFTWDGRPVEYLDLPRSPVRKSAHIDRKLVWATTRGCRECRLRDMCTAPVPPMFPTTHRSSYAVVGEAPGQVEDRKGQVFVGRSGQVLRRILRDAGLDLNAGTWLNTVACRPPDNRTPELDERDACRGNLERGLRAANTRYILLCGATALNTWRVGVKVTRVHGRWFIWWDQDGRGWWVMPTLHPAAALRRPALKSDIAEDVAEFARVVNGNLTPTPAMSCVECGGNMEHWEHDGVAWCGGCWKKKMKNAGKSRGRRKIHPDQASFKF